jgi:hypothetical protein
MTQQQHQHMLLVREGEQPGSDRQLAGQVEHVPGRRTDQASHFIRTGRGYRDRDRGFPRGDDVLARLAAGGREHSAQRFVPACHIVKRGGQRGGIQLAGRPPGG